MAINLTRASLKSWKTRIFNAGSPTGIFRINAPNPLAAVTGALKWLAKKVSQFVGWAFAQLSKYFNFSVSEIFGMLVQAYFLIKTFDWNQADESIRKKIDSNNKAMRDAIAPLIGTALGWGTVRLVNFVIGKFAGAITGKGKQQTPGISIPVISARVGLALAEEGNEEIRGQFLSFVASAKRAQLENMMLGFMLNARSMGLFGMTPINDKRPNGSFSAKIDEEIEKLPDDWQNFAEEILENFEEAIIEAGYVVAFEIDDIWRAAKAAKKDQDGRVRQVELTIEPQIT